MASKDDRHGWIRAALSERGHMQKDVAMAWGCDDAVVSRFIKTGEPELTWERAQSLALMLGIESLDELKLRLREGIAPRRRAPQANEVTTQRRSSNGDAEPEPVRTALDQLKEAVDTVRGLLPAAKVSVSIEYNGNH
jgi:hypothetical protein